MRSWAVYDIPAKGVNTFLFDDGGLNFHVGLLARGRKQLQYY